MVTLSRKRQEVVFRAIADPTRREILGTLRTVGRVATTQKLKADPSADSMQSMVHSAFCAPQLRKRLLHRGYTATTDSGLGSSASPHQLEIVRWGFQSLEGESQ